MKLFKYLFIGLLGFIPCFSSAVSLPQSNWGGNYNVDYNGYAYARDVLTVGTTPTTFTLTNYDFVCLVVSRDSSCEIKYSIDNSTFYNIGWNNFTCIQDKTFYVKGNSSNCKSNAYYFKNGQGFLPSQYTSLQCQTEYNLIPISSVDQNYCTNNGLCPSCNQYTSLECQTEYNLIPISEVTANYCRLNFDLIDPAECPINSGTGAIVRSNLTINNTPYAQNQNINVYIPDFLAWNVAFNDFNTVIEVEGYNADESYIENVINNEKLTPTNEDFEDMLTGFMTNYFPYLALALVFLYLARKIFKLFK